MTNPKDAKPDTKAKPAADADHKQAGGPMDFLMMNVHELMLNSAASGPPRSEEEIEADFDNMPI